MANPPPRQTANRVPAELLFDIPGALFGLNEIRRKKEQSPDIRAIAVCFPQHTGVAVPPTQWIAFNHLDGDDDLFHGVDDVESPTPCDG
jgi:hypothetical protein